MLHTSRFARLAGSASLVAAITLFAPLIANAAASAQDTSFTVAGVNLVIKAGSVTENLSATADHLTFTVPEGENVDLRTVGSRNALDNDAQLAPCNVLKDKTNRLFATGPRTVTVTPSPSPCSSINASEDDTTIFTFSSPSAGSTVNHDTEVQIFWSYEGRMPAAIRLRLSVDGGKTYPTVLAENAVNNGFYVWHVPAMPSASQAHLKIEALSSGSVYAFNISQAFAISGTSPEVVPPTGNGGLTVAPYDYEVDEETRTAATIGVDRGLVADPDKQICNPDTRIKVKGNPAVYYCGVDGKRYVFPNFKTYQTWYGDDFNGVVEIELADMQKIPLGGNVTYRPGARMLKLQSAPEVFAVAADGTLRYVTENVAIRLYGTNWNKMIDDLSDAFFTDYTIGEPVKE